MTVIHSKRKANTSNEASEELVDVGIRYSCDFCYRDISAIPRVQCAECGLLPPSIVHGAGGTTKEETGNKATVSDEVDLCVECFGKGVEFGQHKRGHKYRVLKPLDFPVYEADWRADEELLLLEAVEANGMGNWRDVSNQVGSKTAEECESHYRRLYLDWEGRPLPNPVYRVEGKPKPSKKIVSLDEVLPKKRVKRHNSIDGAGTPWALQSHPANHEITGYMPGRGEFEVEYENEAEAVVKDLVFLEDDTVFDVQLKLAMLEIYSGILDRREARRAFVHQHGLTDFKRHTALDKSRSKEERELFNHVKAFARFVKLDDFQALLDGLVKEEELRRRIAQLQEWRRNGLRSLDQVNSYEAERKHLELYLKGGSALPKTSALPREPFPLPSSKSTNLLTSRGVLNVPMVVDPSALASLGLGKPFASVPTPSFQAPTPSASVVSSGSRKASMPLNISHAEGVDMLSEKEREICSILRLYPRLYITIKDTLIKESLRLGGLKRAQARASVKIDVNKTSKLYDFFITAGWIKPPASGAGE